MHSMLVYLKQPSRFDSVKLIRLLLTLDLFDCKTLAKPCPPLLPFFWLY